jgi:glycosyltransferase involved in cell wall biosynthesis
VIAEAPLDGLESEFVPWSPESETSAIAHADIGLMPLVDDERTRGRCGYKAIQYGAAGLPCVVMGVGGAAEPVLHRTTGIVVDSATDFARAVSTLADDGRLRAEMGAAAREHIEANFSYGRCVTRLERALAEARAHASAR